MNENQPNHDRELSQAVRDLGKALDLLKDVYDTSQKRYESFTHQLRKEHERESRRQRRDAWLIAFLGIFGISLSVIAASYWSYEEKKVELQQTIIQELNNQATEIHNKIKDMYTKRDELMDAMINMRGIRDEGQRQCKNGVYSGKDALDYRNRLFAAGYGLVGAAYKTTGVFNDAIKDKIILFESLADIDKTDICAKGAVTDQSLRPIQTETNNLILDSINALEKQREDTAKRIQGYENG